MNSSKWLVKRANVEPPAGSELDAVLRLVHYYLRLDTFRNSDAIYDFDSILADCKQNGASTGYSTVCSSKPWAELSTEEEAVLETLVARFITTGEYPELVVWYDSLKEETVKRTNIEHGKIRAFAGAPLLFTFLCKMIFGPQQKFFASLAALTPLKDGSGKFRGWYQSFYSQANSVMCEGRKCFSADGRQNDANLAPWVSQAVMQLRFTMMSPRIARYARSLWSAYEDSWHDLGLGDRVKWNGFGLLSGNFLTMTNTGLAMMVLHCLAEVRGCRAIPVAFKGDDRLVVVHADDIQKYTETHRVNNALLEYEVSDVPYGLDFCSTTVKVEDGVALVLSSRPGKILANLKFHAKWGTVVELLQQCYVELACDADAIRTLRKVREYVETKTRKQVVIATPVLEDLYSVSYGFFQGLWSRDPA